MSVIHFMGHGMTACMRPGVPKDWPVNHRWTVEWDKVNCPDCLRGRELIETFIIANDRRSITCKRCGRTSWHPQDVQRHYCAYCGVFHDDLWPPARRWWIEHLGSGMVGVTCECGFRLGVRRDCLEEIQSGAWGTIPCPQCKKRLNDKLLALE